MEVVAEFGDEPEIKNRLINCLLIDRHFIMVL